MPCQFCSSAGCDFTDVYVHAKSLQSCLSVTPWTAAPKALLSMGFTRQEPWSGSRAPQGVVPAQGQPGSAWLLPWEVCSSSLRRRAPLTDGPPAV